MEYDQCFFRGYIPPKKIIFGGRRGWRKSALRVKISTFTSKKNLGRYARLEKKCSPDKNLGIFLKIWLKIKGILISVEFLARIPPLVSDLKKTRGGILANPILDPKIFRLRRAKNTVFERFSKKSSKKFPAFGRIEENKGGILIKGGILKVNSTDVLVGRILFTNFRKHGK